MKRVAVLGMFFYLCSSFPCGLGAKDLCCANAATVESTQTCHSTSHAQDQSKKTSDFFSPCCCSYSADLPKGVEFKRVDNTFLAPLFLLGRSHEVDLNQFFAASLVDPPQEIFTRNFIYFVFKAQAPPIII